MLFSPFRPNNIEDYIHRIGRTGRAGATGVAISFFTEKHSRLAKDLVEVLVKANQNVPKELQAFVPERGNGSGGGRSHYGGGGGNGVGNGSSAAGVPRTMVGSSTMKAYATSVGSRGVQRGDRYY
jgi:ATP-dependent RNA helicase DDX5/DBP2